MNRTDQSRAQRLLWKLYTHHDAFIRSRGFSWSAELVAPGQSQPPYRTYVVYEAQSLTALIEWLESR